jgi:hypothetical protein
MKSSRVQSMTWSARSDLTVSTFLVFHTALTSASKYLAS